MECIVGLGNIGRRFERIRRNTDFEVIDYILDKNQSILDKQKFRGVYTTERLNGDKVLFIESITMMNLPGEAVGPLVDYYNVEVEDSIVLYDDIDLSQGHVHLHQKGSVGGHNGMKPIIKHLGTDQLKRTHIEVRKPTSDMSVPDYVLQKFSNEGMMTMERVIEHTAQAVEAFIEASRLDHIMNGYNGEVN